MDITRFRYAPALIREPTSVIIPRVSQEKFTKKDWQDLPRKRKKKIKKLMLDLNQIINKS